MARFTIAGGGSGGGGAQAPTFIINETTRRSDVFTVSPRLNETERRRDALNLQSVRLAEQVNRLDAYRLPTISVRPPETVNHADSIIFRPTLPESQRRSDAVTMEVNYLSAGTFTFTAPVTGNYRLDSWGGGASGGGAGALGAGGGGGGGAFGRTNSIARTAGQTFTVRVAATVAGVGTLTAGVAGNQSWISTTGVAPANTTQGCLAAGGSAGGAGGVGAGTGGAGGTVAASIGDTRFAGGAGANGGVGGGGAGDSAAGSGQTGGSAGGGNGGASATAGAQAGGGGGGGPLLGTSGGGALGRGRIRFSF